MVYDRIVFVFFFFCKQKLERDKENAQNREHAKDAT